MTTRPSLLLISFSPLRSDARILKQIGLLRDDYEVTTLGYGAAPDGAAAHIEVPASEDFQDLNGRLITLHLYRRAYWNLSAVRWARTRLPIGTFDVILANEMEAVPLALSLRPRGGVHADLHEYTPKLKEEFPEWDRRIRPFWEWVARRYVTKAQSWTTVSPAIVDTYEEKFGFRPELVTNAAPLSDFTPGPVHQPIRIVHSGACLRNRRLEILLDAMERTSADVSLDFYLTPNDPAFLAELRERAARMTNVTVHDPLPYAELIRTLNAYDVGVHVLPPTNFNNAAALPNKLFEYAQARLGVIVGPSPEMARYVRELGFGAVTEGFTAEHLSAVVDALTPERVLAWKQAAHENAVSLSAQSQLPVWGHAIRRLAAAAEGKR
ncbi:glycosyltransferase family 1 protein [Microbacterium sp. M28]|uniref:glycosyltransferase n=1 Tax=Microbacterium sp. M28 TaxID=2962064 RepID=UPI0021F491BE|nr:glycosyltransferase [Microbacterium sp. M28]UYO98167.1 glycosyltransferase family 1 protein [Microbacterium sp. M28]